jgi:hypothetical protein
MPLIQPQRKSLGLPHKGGKRFYRVPGYKGYFHLLSQLNPDVLVESLSDGLRTHGGSLPASLRWTGKGCGTPSGWSAWRIMKRGSLTRWPVEA